MAFLSSQTIPHMGCTVGFGLPLSAQLLSRIGFSYLLIDMEHNPLSAREATSLTHAIVAASQGACKSIIRVPAHGSEWIKWALDSGADGVLIPMVQSKTEMGQIVQAALYPPRGQRSFGPAMAPFASTDPSSTAAKYLTEKSPQVAVIPMIESVNGLNNAEEICTVDGVSAVFVGPVDLRFSMGLPGGDGTEQAYLAALEKLVGICRSLGKPIGTFASNEECCRRRTAEGFDFLLLPGEAATLEYGARMQLEACLRGAKAARL